MMCKTPNPKSIVNHKTINGPNIFPTLFVPNRWKKNNIERIKITIGIVGRCSKPFNIRSPSTAEETETGGVIIPSASNAEAPIIVGIIKFLPFFLISEYNEKIPPSPSLSAFSVNHTYLIEV